MRPAPDDELSLLLPTLDEAAALARLLPRLLEEVPRLGQLIVIDDGSTDGTRELVRRAALRDPRVSLIARDAQPSLVASLRAGIAEARCPLIAWMDADGTIPPSDLIRLLAVVDDGAPIAIGSRFAPGGAIKGRSEERGLLGRALSTFSVVSSEDRALAVLGSWVLNVAVLPLILGDLSDSVRHDYTSGFIVGRREVIERFELRGHHGEYFIDLFAQAKKRGVPIVEVPYRAQARREGRSKTVTRLSDYAKHARRYLGVALRTRRESRR